MPVTKVPLISDYINGVINLRGKVIPIIDIFAKSPLKKQVITNPINTINVNELKRALELDRDGDWDSAHKIIQRIESMDYYWIHAYLHRKEGALGNSNYWYNRAKKTMPEYDLDQ